MIFINADKTIRKEEIIQEVEFKFPSLHILKHHRIC